MAGTNDRYDDKLKGDSWSDLPCRTAVRCRRLAGVGYVMLRRNKSIDSDVSCKMDVCGGAMRRRRRACAGRPAAPCDEREQQGEPHQTEPGLGESLPQPHAHR